MPTDDRIDKLVRAEVRYQIPAELLGYLGDAETINRMAGESLTYVRESTVRDIPRSWESKVIRYVVSQLRQRIVDKYDMDQTGWKPTNPHFGEVLKEYRDEASIAIDIFETLRKVQVMTCRPRFV